MIFSTQSFPACRNGLPNALVLLACRKLYHDCCRTPCLLHNNRLQHNRRSGAASIQLLGSSRARNEAARERSAQMNIARTIDLGVEECDRSATTAARSACSKPASTHDWINTIQLYRFPLGLAVVAVHTGEFALSVAGKGEPGSMAGGFGQWLGQSWSEPPRQ